MRQNLFKKMHGVRTWKKINKYDKIDLVKINLLD